ncbi:histidine--tRNA ligase [uncultured Bacteroides sp.]|uniref:histidine--tRNA ligase n=1 Tax=uncultured Bacteroides sp. TaxID=162156 RepID=UPI0026183619|nr:histidine--tRNA ligase [uncultured Bacteroides sp.]
MATKISIPKGTRDFSPIEMNKRNYIFDTIREVYSLYGFQQIETPALEQLSTLMGKYGEEGDKLLFKILDSGSYFGDFSYEQLFSQLIKESLRKGYLKIYKNHKFKSNMDLNTLDQKLRALIIDLIQRGVGREKGLRYDLTVPFARYVVMHRDEITFPFKRYQIQPVWRADRPQKGRYREFYQCDADVVGSDSLLNEVELMQIVDTVFTRFGIRVCIKINNRKILTGIAEIIGEADKIVDITVAIDKLDKIGLDNVNAELREKGIGDEAIAKLQPIILLSGTNEEKLVTLKEVLADSETGLKGVEESEFILSTLKNLGLKNEIELDLTLARGLNYYTGAIFEVKALDVQIGSITGGGRYDNLTGVFGLSGVSGVGISFGADRIFDVLNQLDLYPKEAVNATQVLFINFGEKEVAFSMQVLAQVRAAGIRAEIFPDASKMKKQMGYANSKNIPFVVLVGENEMNEGKVTLKNMETGEQRLVTAQELIEELC